MVMDVHLHQGEGALSISKFLIAFGNMDFWWAAFFLIAAKFM